MKARTKLQREVVHLSDNVLPQISKLEKKYAEIHALDHMAFVSKTGAAHCMDCGHSWKTKLPIDCPKWHTEIIKEDIVCPNCKTKLIIKETQKRTGNDYSTFGMITTCKGFQVIRVFDVNSFIKTKQKKEIWYIERGQIWIAPNGKHEIIGYNKGGYSGWFHGQWSLKHRSNAHNYSGKPFILYPRIRVTKKLKRNGFYGDFFDIRPFDFFKGLILSTHAETLLKEGYKELFRHVINDEHRTKNLIRYWSSIKIAMKLNYRIQDANSYMDYLRWLEQFGRDLHSPKYLCPRDFEKEHNKYVEKLRIIRRDEQRVLDLKKIKANKLKFKREQLAYERWIKKYSKIEIQSKNVVIKPFKTLKEIENVGAELRHCIFAPRYYNDRNSLLMCAYSLLTGKPVETAEIRLRSLKVEQSRGFLNKNSTYHKDILSMIDQNMELIRKAYKTKKVKLKKKAA